MHSYSINIPDDKATTYPVVTFIIAVINLLAFGYLLFTSSGRAIHSMIILGFIMSILAVVFYLIKYFSIYFSSFRIEISFIICAIAWLVAGYYLLAFLLLAFALLGFATNKNLVIHFSEEGIRYPSFPVRLYRWSEVDFVILKDDILSIEMKDNRLLQFTLEQSIASKIDDLVFNAFCAQQITASL
jgi:hypothetical protein